MEHEQVFQEVMGNGQLKQRGTESECEGSGGKSPAN